jgi:hypothetical protein
MRLTNHDRWSHDELMSDIEQKLTKDEFEVVCGLETRMRKAEAGIESWSETYDATCRFILGCNCATYNLRISRCIKQNQCTCEAKQIIAHSNLEFDAAATP